MHPDEFKRLRTDVLRLTQEQLAERLRTTRMTITRYEGGTRRIPGVIDVALTQLAASALPMAGVVAAGSPIEPIPQTEFVDVPPAMMRGKDHFALKVKGQSMRDEGILPGDLVIVRKQTTARNGQTVVGLLNREATLKTYYRKAGRIELHPANAAMDPIVVRAKDDFQIQGVVVGVIRYYET